MSGTASERLTSPLEALYWTQYATWFPIFRKHAPKSTVIDIDTVQPELLDWLEADTFVLPEGSGPSTNFSSSSSNSGLSLSRSENDDKEEQSDGEEEDEVVKFTALDAAIRGVVEKYDGGPVFPKLNWSAPLDAGFMLPGNNLQCLHPEDVYLLLKSSEFVGRDLEQISHTATTATTATPFPKAQESVDATDSSPFSISTSTITTANAEQGGGAKLKIRPHLVLKKWVQLSRSYEFRCFVRSNALIAISQRDVTFYDHLQDAFQQSKIRGAIWGFWQKVMVQAKQAGRWTVGDYIFDVYLTKDMGRVWLIDVNAWLPRTDPLLWNFEELEEVHQREKACSREDSGVEEVEQGVVRLQIHSTAQDQTSRLGGNDEESEGEGEEWSESDVELRVIVDRRMQSSGGTGATYSSNMVPKDLVDFAKTSNPGSAGSEGMSVDQIVKRWNDQVASEEDQN